MRRLAMMNLKRLFVKALIIRVSSSQISGCSLCLESDASLDDQSEWEKEEKSIFRQKMIL